MCISISLELCPFILFLSLSSSLRLFIPDISSSTRPYVMKGVFTHQLLLLSDRFSDATQEVCQLETMKARCPWNSEVIVMTSARWGRMKTGRCLDIHPNFLSLFGEDPLFLGCSANVLPLLDAKCSGRPECDIAIPDPDLDKLNPCYPDHERYLEASYMCVKGQFYFV